MHVMHSFMFQLMRPLKVKTCNKFHIEEEGGQTVFVNTVEGLEKAR